ncbi:phosphohydrolase [Nocardia sp. ET3-3]|uniref:Phosphohydrolase n=1 Tax=Nocardia terrae TaxID=2675851 RepID=A0A7K1V751_9NOCA|nr:phosphohydrolase [Nocardia terrae]MVU81938.1 phosphohydrolase [Nocardia terrae]
MNRQIESLVTDRLDTWAGDLGEDREMYTNHVLRVLSFCDLQAGSAPGSVDAPSSREEFRTAAVFHDLGVWTAHTFDYLAPSISLACDWLVRHGQHRLMPIVAAMIDDHHKIRPIDGPYPEAEVFRRADLVDVSAGLIRFGIARADYRQVVNRYPDAGFRRRLARLGTQRLRSHPWSPLPMLKW